MCSEHVTVLLRETVESLEESVKWIKKSIDTF